MNIFVYQQTHIHTDTSLCLPSSGMCYRMGAHIHAPWNRCQRRSLKQGATELQEGFCWKGSHGLQKEAEVQKQKSRKSVCAYHVKLLDAFMLLEVQRKGLWTWSLVLPRKINILWFQRQSKHKIRRQSLNAPPCICPVAFMIASCIL